MLSLHDFPFAVFERHFDAINYHSSAGFQEVARRVFVRCHQASQRLVERRAWAAIIQAAIRESILAPSMLQASPNHTNFFAKLIQHRMVTSDS
jgi:hypothetical protein